MKRGVSRLTGGIAAMSITACGTPPPAPAAAIELASPVADPPPADAPTAAKPPDPPAPVPSGVLVLTDAGLARLPLDAPPSVEALAPLFAPFEVWMDNHTFDNAPDHPVSIVCIGKPPHCAVELFEDGGKVHRVVALRHDVVGPHGIRIEAPYRDVKPHLTGCAVMLGDESGVSCRVIDHPRVLVVLISDVLLHRTATSETPTPAQLADAKVIRMEWSPDP